MTPENYVSNRYLTCYKNSCISDKGNKNGLINAPVIKSTVTPQKKLHKQLWSLVDRMLLSMRLQRRWINFAVADIKSSTYNHHNKNLFHMIYIIFN